MENEEPKVMDMSPWYLVGAQPSFGFDLLARKQKLKMRLLSTGGRGVESLIHALIGTGCNKRTEIVKEVCDIAGDHVAALVDEVLSEGCGHYWTYNETGASYSPISLH